MRKQRRDRWTLKTEKLVMEAVKLVAEERNTARDVYLTKIRPSRQFVASNNFVPISLKVL